jgi:hypothetical protein
VPVAREGERWRGAVAKLQRAIMCAGGRETEGKRAGEESSPQGGAQAVACGSSERRGGGCYGDRNAVAMATARASRARRGGCEFDGF